MNGSSSHCYRAKGGSCCVNCGGLKSWLKAFLLLLMLSFSASVMVGQGTVTFANNVAFTTPGDRLVRDINGARLVGTNYFAQLYYGAQGAAETDLISVSHIPARFRSSTTTQPGTWLVGDTAVRTLDGFSFGDTLSLQVRVWDSFAGSTWEQSAAINFGETQHGTSIIFLYTVPPAGCQPPGCYLMEGLRGFMLVPEPSVIALAALGAGALLLLRRRK